MPRTWRFRSPAHDCHLLYTSPAQGSRTAHVVVYRPSAPPPPFVFPLYRRWTCVVVHQPRPSPRSSCHLPSTLPPACCRPPLCSARLVFAFACAYWVPCPPRSGLRLCPLYNSPATRTTTRPCNRSCRPTVKSRTGIRAPRVPRSFTALVSVSSPHAVSTIPSHGAVAYHHRRPSAHPSICPSTHSASIPPPTVWPLRALVSAARPARARCLPLVPV